MIDIRELRIGSSVLLCGNRVKVTELSQEQIAVGNYVEREGSKFPIGYTSDQIDPIPITEELLRELGFEGATTPEEGWYYGIEKVFEREFDSPIEEDYHIFLAQHEGGLYQLQVLGVLAFVRNLHELEAFVYLTTKQELI